MHAPVSMLSGFAAKGNTALVLGLLVGLAVVASIKASPTQPTNKPRANP